MTFLLTQEYVVDASVIIGYFLESDAHHTKVIPYWESLNSNASRFHLPTLAVVEAVSALHRRTAIDRRHLVNTTLVTLRELTSSGYITQYSLDGPRSQRAITAALQYSLRGADAVYAALADELQLGLLTVDGDFKSYPNAVVLL